MHTSTGQPHDSGWYEIRVRGSLDRRWSARLDGMDLTVDPDGTTLLRGRVVDQAALHGLIARLRDLGLPLISISEAAPDPADSDATRRTDPSNPGE